MLKRPLALAIVGMLTGLCACNRNEKPQISPISLNERFQEAVRQGNFPEIRQLLDQGADVRAKDGLGSTPLLLAARKTDNVELVRFLLERAPELLEVPDSTGRTPLSWSAQDDRLQVLRFLLERKATVDARDVTGRTPFFHAVVGEQLQAVRLLLERGAKVDARDQFSDTPLMLASAKGNAALVRLLLDAKADAAAKNQEGRTALDRAADDAIRRLLRGE
jgi:ankyrin repeat protein